MLLNINDDLNIKHNNIGLLCGHIGVCVCVCVCVCHWLRPTLLPKHNLCLSAHDRLIINHTLPLSCQQCPLSHS